MWKLILLWLCLSGYCLGGPLGPKRNMPIIQHQEEEMDKESTAVATENDTNKPEAGDTTPNMLMISTLTLPSNATSIRADITDGFSCANKSYGYYADVENDCQIFHVCLPVTYADGRENTFRWSFICPEETIFSQDSFTCMRREDMTIDCEESFKYYELNRNFGMTEEDENKNMEGSSNGDTNSHLGSEDQESAMTTHVEHEKQPQQTQNSQLPLQHEQQLMSNEKPEKVSSSHTSKPMQLTSQKEKPVKVQKPNRRKPSTSTSNISHKKKPAMPLRKTTQTTTSQPAIDVTVTSAPKEEETKPPRFTKRPPTMSINLKEKLQPVMQPESTPVRADLFNQKRKRPSIFNKKDTTTLKPVEDLAPTTELTTAEELSTTGETETVKSTVNLSDVAPQASETNIVMVKPTSALPSNDVKTGEEKKITKPQPTEPEAILPEVTKSEESPMVVPLEAIEEIPAVIAEVEENNSNQEPAKPLENAKADVDGTEEIEQISIQEPVENTPSETHVDSPAIFQPNSEENSGSVVVPLIEEMEDQKPNNAPDMMPATLDMEHQDPMIEQMLSETDPEANKQSMGGFKPVDPAMAAEAEALIANFLNTLMKSEKIDNNEPNQVPSNDLVNHEPEEPNQQGESQTIGQEIKMQTLSETEAQQTDSSLSMQPGSEQQTPLKDIPTPFPSMMMMMNNHPDEIFQIPVQVIQSPAEETTIVSNSEETSLPNDGDSIKPEVPRPLSIDDIVELVKDKLDQVPETKPEAETEKDKEIQNPKSSVSEEIIKDESIAEALQKPNELIVPIYHRVSGEPNGNMVKAHDQDEKIKVQDDHIAAPTNFANISETETDAESNAPTIIAIKSKTDRALRARNIKTAEKMDPRKRRFLFKSDAS